MSCPLPGLAIVAWSTSVIYAVEFLSYFQYSISSYFKADRKFTVLKDRIYSSFLKTLNRNDSNHSSRLFEAFLLLKQ